MQSNLLILKSNSTYQISIMPILYNKSNTKAIKIFNLVKINLNQY